MSVNTCKTFELICPVESTQKCTWEIGCCSEEQAGIEEIDLQPNQRTLVCLDVDGLYGQINGSPYAILITPGNGLPAQSIDEDCNTQCGDQDVTPIPPTPTPTPTPTPPITPTPTPTPSVVTCLQRDNTVSFGVENGVNVYKFNGAYATPYATTVGTYILKDVPAQHPIAFQNFNLTNVITYTGTNTAGTKVGLDGNTYSYYWGDVTITVVGGYGTISYECFYHGYMGGENNLVYNGDVCTVPTPPPVPPTPPTPPTPSTVPPIPSPITTNYTLTYSEGVKGWPSFYSFDPDYMVGMNNYLYSFKAGNLYRHNTNETRNNYYGIQYSSQITTVFNESPLDNKIFKSLNLEADSAWTVSAASDIQTRGFIDSRWFDKKEGSYFAYIRKTGTTPAFAGEYAYRSAQGIGKATSWSETNNILTLNFSVAPITDISMLSIGDYIYFSEGAYTTISFSGQITNIEVNIASGINRIFVNTNFTQNVFISETTPFILGLRNTEAEDVGLLGHDMTVTLENANTTATELFAIESEVMKSFP